MQIKYVDKKYKFIELFDTESGAYLRTGVIENEKDTGVDPFMRSFPQLLDVGIMGSCEHGKKGLCRAAGIECYQNGLNKYVEHMSFKNFKKIVDECKGVTFQFALGGRGDPNKHPEFEDIISYCRKNNITPNYTTSGLNLTDQEVQLTKKYCGAVAVSWYRHKHTNNALEKFINAGCKTNIHYVLGNNSIDEAIERLKGKGFIKGLNAVIFLLHKPVGLGTETNVLKPTDPRLKEFFGLVDNKKHDFKIGFDACSIPGVINNTSNINPDSMDTCEGGRYSAYITSDMKMLPCSFDNDNLKWAYDISEDSIKNAWESDVFENFRNHFRNSCSKCDKRSLCLGGCPIVNEIVLCDKPEKEIYDEIPW